MKIRILFLLTFGLASWPVSFAAQPAARISTAEYITKYKEDAIRDMMRMGVPASITLAQGILESESGNSDLARYANNHFGIKCHNDWTGATYHKDDDAKDECFRKYNDVLESFYDHGRFLRERPRYAFLFDMEITDYKAWAHGLKKAGYATNPRYAELLIKLIEENNLDAYDRGGKRLPVNGQSQIADQNQRPAPQPAKPAHHPKTKPVQPGNFNTNHVPYVLADPGDSWLSVAMNNDMRLWQILKYNDADEDDILSPGDIVYLKPKRGRPDAATHLVQPGESLRDIAQLHGVKMNRLIKLNHFEESIALSPGQTVKLR